MKHLLTALIFIFFSTTSSGQLYLRMGPSLANLSSGSGVFENTTKSYVRGYSGLMYKFEFTHHIAIRPGLFFSAKGAKYDFKDLGIDIDEGIRLNYIEVPLDLVYSFAGLDLHVGPYLAMGVSAEEYESDQTKDLAFGDVINRTDFGFNIGAAYNFHRFSIGAQYGLGLSSITAKEGPSIKNRVASIYWTFRITGEKEVDIDHE